MSFKRIEATILNLEVTNYRAGGFSEMKSCNLDPDEKKYL